MFSGGKDSTYALHWAFLHGFRVKCLLTLMPARDDSWMFHRPAVEYTRLQAEALNIEHVTMPVSGVKGREVGELREALRFVMERFGVEGVVTGALLSDYQRMNINMVSEELGLKVFSPLWRKDQRAYLIDLYNMGIRFIITSIDSYGLDPGLMGKVLSMEDLLKLIELSKRYGFNPAFEGGEAETFVVDAPLFRRRIAVEGYVKRVGEYSWRFIITRAWLTDKPTYGQHYPQAYPTTSPNPS